MIFWNNEITHSYENTNIQDYFLVALFKNIWNSANIDINFFPLHLLTELHFLCFSLLLLFMDVCYNFHHLLVVCFGLFVGLFLTTNTDFAEIFHMLTFIWIIFSFWFGCGCKWYLGLCWIWLLGRGRRHSSSSYYWIDIGSVSIDLPKLLNVCGRFFSCCHWWCCGLIRFSTVGPLALSLGLCNMRTCPPSENVGAIFSYTAFSLVLGSAKAFVFSSTLGLAGALVSCPGVCWCWLQSGVAGGWLAGERWLQSPWLAWWWACRVLQILKKRGL